MALEEETRASMQALARLALSGEITPVPGAAAGRLSVYHGLVKNVFTDSLEQAFPLTKAAFAKASSNRPADAWEEMVSAFVRSGPKTSPQLWRMPEEFVEFVVAGDYAERFFAPWLPDLLAFEWLEIEVYMMENGPLPRGAILPGSLPGSEMRPISGSIAENPDFRVLALEYPVFRSLQEEELCRKGNYFLLAFRHLDTCKVHFVSLSPEMVLVTVWLAGTTLTADEIFTKLTNTAGCRMTRAELQEQIDALSRDGFFLGTQKEEGQ